MTFDRSAATPPIAARRMSRTTHHGIAVEDPYAWLRAENWREVMRAPSTLSADIAGYLTAENDYAEAMLAPLKDLRETLFAEMRGRIAETDWSVPTPDGPHAYGSDYVDGGEHPRLIRLTRRDGEALQEGDDLPPTELLLDGNAEAGESGYFRLGGITHAPNHDAIAWSCDRAGAELFTLYRRDLTTGEDTVLFEDVTPAATFAANSRTVFTVALDDNHRPCKVLARAPGEAIRTLYEEADAGFFVGVSKTLSGRFIVIDSHDHETSEVRLVDAIDPGAAPVVVAERLVGEEYDVAHHGEHLFIRTNREARDFRIARAPVDSPDRAHWEDVVPHRPGIFIVSMAVFEDYLVWLERENALPRIVIRRHADGDTHTIAFDEEAYALGLSEGYEFSTQTLRFTYASMTTPSQVWDYNMATRERRLRKRQRIPSGHDPSQYVTRRLVAMASDGAPVPVSLVHHVSTPIDGTAPCLVYGYGAYGITIPAAFNANALSLVNRGVVYAIAHVRGGMDRGFDWYDGGRRERKENTFSDFVVATDHLIAEGYAAPGRVAAQGGSAGGMLMGAIANRAPDRYAAIIAEVPFVDVLATMLDDTLPLTPPEWPEWGDPIRDPEAFRRLLGYSPVDNVSAQAYPAILALAGVSDPRVTYWEPAKWVARLRATATNDPLIVLRTNMEAGHAGASGRFKRLEEIALVQAFVLASVGALHG